MELVQMIAVTAVLLLAGVVGMAITILVKKNGRFPETHIGHNKEMRKRKIQCAKSWDRQEQFKVQESLRKQQESLLADFEEPESSVKSSFKGLHLAD